MFAGVEKDRLTSLDILDEVAPPKDMESCVTSTMLHCKFQIKRAGMHMQTPMLTRRTQHSVCDR
jgi:hypothetical protein